MTYNPRRLTFVCLGGWTHIARRVRHFARPGAKCLNVFLFEGETHFVRVGSGSGTCVIKNARAESSFTLPAGSRQTTRIPFTSRISQGNSLRRDDRTRQRVPGLRSSVHKVDVTLTKGVPGRQIVPRGRDEIEKRREAFITYFTICYLGVRRPCARVLPTQKLKLSRQSVGSCSVPALARER